MSVATQPTIELLQERFAAHGQQHVFRFWARLDELQQARLSRQAAAIEPGLAELVDAWRSLAHAAPGVTAPVAPIEAIALPERGGDASRFARARARGEQILAEGRVAVMVVAGGQGTRLGFPGPKGALPFGPVTKRTLFELQAQKIRGLRRRHGRDVAWYVMTSDATDAETRRLFEHADYFGLPAGDVRIFRQEMVPAFDLEGRLVLERPDRIFESPNGHGGAITALVSSGSLDDMESRGVDTLFYYQVDNPLVRIADPAYLGLHDETSSEMSCKVVRKLDPMTKVGVVARTGTRPGVIEYTELDADRRDARDAEGNLVYWAGNVAIHLFSTAFVREVASNAAELLPYHESAKKIPTIDDEGRPVSPSEPNGTKLERFVFDALAAARNVCVVETSEALEFAPIKNAEGLDSPGTARAALASLYRSWIEAAGLDPAPDGRAIEIDHARIDSAEDAAAAGFRSWEDVGDAIRIAPGTDS